MEEIITIDTSALREKETEANLVIAGATVTIANHEQYEAANNDLAAVKNKIKELDDMRKSITRPIDEGKKRIMALFSVPLDRLEKAKTAISRAMLSWDQEQERKRQELQAKLQREADEKARKEQERLAARAEKAAEKGQADKAEALLEQAAEVIAQPVPVIQAPPRPKGQAIVDNWKAEIVDIDLVPREYMIPDMVALNKIMKATKGTLKIPGVKAVNEPFISNRAA